MRSVFMARGGFTLVELLTVIAVISVLAALLLPTMDAALKQSRRLVCSNQLHQQYIGAQTYASEFNGFLPRPGVWGADPSVDTNAYRSKTNMPCRVDGAWVPPYYDTAWYILLNRLAYFPLDAVSCPDMDTPAQAAGNVHYDYLYNSARSCNGSAVYQQRNDPKRLMWPLFNDSACYRLMSVAPFAVSQQTSGIYMKWAHLDGGNIAYHSGAIRFLPNWTACPFIGNYCWPSSVSTFTGFMTVPAAAEYIAGR